MREQDQKAKREQFRELMKEIRQNSETGMSHFYEIYGKLIQTTAQTVCRNAEETKETVNAILVKIWRFAQKSQVIENPAGWIYIITTNYAKDLLRKRTALPLNENILSDKDEIEEVVEKDAFATLIKDLSKIEKAIMVYKFSERYTFQDIADMLGKPLTSISSIYYRALNKIKKDIEKKY